MCKEIKVLALKTENKPKEIPDHLWIKPYTWYTLIDANIVKPSNEVVFTLKEIDLEGNNILAENGLPYKGFMMNRFGLILDDMERIRELCLTKSPLKELGLETEKNEAQISMQLSQAVEEEDYILAAKLRDKLKDLQKSKP